MHRDDTIPAGFCQCGCGQRPRNRKAAYVRGHRPWRQISPDDYTVDGDTGCWNWQRSLNANGYGRISRTTGSRLAHRVAYEQFVAPVPEGMVLDHLCGNPRCVNPEHLEAVTRAVNSQRGRHAKLTPEDVAEIRSLFATMTSVAIARRFNVDRSTIHEIKTGRSWR
ncbi:MAG: HNH endonuclease [Dehalococcoidia bacterium]|nr:HNH endonuclease [Dehalococcoidia bacterium]